jgi:hypothetical protein
MHGHADEWIEDRVKWKASAFTYRRSDILFFAGHDDDTRTALRHVAADRSVGLPIMAFRRSDELWTLLGSEKLVWARNGQIHEVLLDAVKWADSPGMLDTMRQEVDALAADRHKFECETLRVTDNRGFEFMVWTAPGGGCLVLWNVLLMLIRMQKK